VHRGEEKTPNTKSSKTKVVNEAFLKYIIAPEVLCG
jgi:hypothetical protein